MVRRGMQARDMLVRQVRRIEWAEATSILTESRASVSMLWARILPLCFSGSLCRSPISFRDFIRLHF